jgi:predicted AAA+ superfamily ATPase
VTRTLVDETNEFGQFLLTGSSSPLETKNLHSGAGRIEYLTLRPLTLTENKKSAKLINFFDLFEENKNFTFINN